MAAGRFTASLPYTLREEGGYSNNPRDPGGSTDRGVTQARYDQFRKSAGLQKRDVRQMSETELQTLYRTGYWDAVGAETLEPGVDLSVFDYAVNSGPARARAALLKAIGGAAAQTIGKIADIRLSFLHGISGAGGWAAFGKGWGARVARIEAASLKIAGAPIAPHAAAATAKAKSAAVKAKSAAAAAPGGAAGAHVAGGHTLLAVAILVVVLAAAGVAAYAAWRQRQRASALNAAAAELARETVAAEADAKTPVKS